LCGNGLTRSKLLSIRWTYLRLNSDIQGGIPAFVERDLIAALPPELARTAIPFIQCAGSIPDLNRNDVCLLYC
jgi:hypothetical protein